MTYIPGWFLMLAIVLSSGWLSSLFAIDGKSFLDRTVMAIILGMIVGNLIDLPEVFRVGVKNFEKVLKTGIVLLGLSLSFAELLRMGLSAMMVILICIITAPVLIYFMGRRLGLSSNLTILIGVGTTICGGTAIAVTAPVIQAKEEDVSYAVATIALFGLVAIFVFPLIGHFLNIGQTPFGIWAGTAIHSTPQVVGAGYIYGEIAGQTATVTKLIRNLFMLPVVVLVGLWYSRREVAAGGSQLNRQNCLAAFPLFLLGFLALSILRTFLDRYQLMPHTEWEALTGLAYDLAKYLILMAMAGIGMCSRFESLRRMGLKPFALGLIASVILALLSISVINIIRVG